MTSALTVYITIPAAPLCTRVCEYLDRRGYPYTTIAVITDEDRARLHRATGRSSCPVVVAGDHVIGRLQDTVQADRSGRLRELLTTPPRQRSPDAQDDA
jgi:glutaredoxin